MRYLRRLYPDAHCSLHFSSPLELLVATILSAQCTDERVNLVTQTLFKKYRSAADYASAPPRQLEKEIRSTGFYQTKAKNIIACCRALVERHEGEVPRRMEDLVQLAGVGRKTANVILGNCFEVPGITVDTHVRRLSRRLGLTAEEDPVKIEFALQRLLPKKDWTFFSHAMIWHGRQICDARQPKCRECLLNKICPAAMLD